MTTLAAWALSSVVSEICLRASLPYNRINVNGLAGTVDGFSLTNAHPAYTGIEDLAKVFFFDPCNYDGMINFVPRGGNVVAGIVTADLVDEGDELSRVTRRDSISVPRVYNMNYYDIDGGLATSKQTSDRSLDIRSTSEVSLETTVLMDADTAARTVVINHKVAIEEQRGEKEFSLPDSWLWLTTGDLITLDGERLRIKKIQIDDGFQKYEAAYDRKSAYQSTITGVVAEPPSVTPTLNVGTTVLQFIDSHILRDADDRLGYYVAVAGASEAWRGATVELSNDGGASYAASTTAAIGCVMGTLTAVLPTHRREYPDERNVLTVQMLKNSFEVAGTDLAGMMNRANRAIVGDELINFADAVETATPGVWELSYLLRGRKGSTIVQHEIGERFVLLNRQNIGFINAELFQLNRELTFRATTFGAASGTVQTVTFLGNAQIERAPEYLTVERSGGNLVIAWQGVGKLGGGAAVGMGAFFTGYRVTVNGAAQDTTAQTLTVTDPGGSVTITVKQINSITGVGDAATVVI